jgi:hypothetical protein
MTTKAVKKVEATDVMTPDAIIHVIERAATNPDVDIDKMERLMDMHERLMEKQAETAFNKAMIEAQKECRVVVADKRNEQTHSDYASYEAMDRVLRPVYTKHGFAITFNTGDGAPDNYVRVVCDVLHTDGHSKSYHIDMPADGKGAKGGDVMTKTHAVGSGTTYGRRYLVNMIFNLSVGFYDDDGNAASVATVTESQAADLNAMLDEVGADKALFLKWCKSESIEAIAAHKFDACIDRLEEMRQ